MNNLPTDVYYRIFRNLRRLDIYTCLFVCRRLNDAAVQVYCEELIIDDYKVKLAQGYLASDDPSMYFRKGHIVQKLILKRTYGGGIKSFRDEIRAFRGTFTFSKAEFLLLLKYFPNIKEIDLKESCNFTKYISFIFDADLRSIKKIEAYQQYFGNNSYYKYLSTCFKFRGTLTSLFLEYTERTKDYSFCGVGTLDTLSQFKNLKQLKFRCNYSDNSIMFRIQELCPQLTDLEFTSRLSRSEGNVILLPKQRVKHTVKSNKSLRHLDINLPSLSIDYTKDLTRYLEDTLHTVNIQVSMTGLYFWIENVGMEDVLKLMRKLGQLNDVCISFTRFDGRQRRGLVSELKMNQWFQVANAFKGNKKALCTVKFYGANSLQDHFKYSSLDKRLIFDFELAAVDIFKEEGDPEHGFFRRFSKFISPNRSISTIGPEFVDCLELNLGKQEDYVVLAFLEYALINYINLQYLP